MVWKDTDRKIGFALQESGGNGAITSSPQAVLANGAPAAGNNGNQAPAVPQSRRQNEGQGGRKKVQPVDSDGAGDRVHVEGDGSIRLAVSQSADLSSTYGTMVELDNMIEQGNIALMQNKDSEARISQIQIQLQRLQKILGIIEQNIAGKLQFGFGLIKMYDQIFQRPQLQA